MRLKTKILLSLAACLCLLFSISSVPAMAIDTPGAIRCGVNGAAGVNDCDAKPEGSLDATIESVINVLSVIIGVIAVIMIIIAGFRYITSGGASDKVSSAKSTLLYAVVGLIIVALAQIIARFVLNTVA